jgi:hypothetical protein
MSTAHDVSSLAVGFLAARKIIGTAWTPESAEFQTVIAERQKAKEICCTGNVPQNSMWSRDNA